MTTVDTLIVGAGIVGLATAREALRRDPDARLAVLERERTVGAHQTGHNSGVIHSGLYYTPGSLKARLCVEGRRRLERFCDEHGIPYRRCGKLVIAARRDELPRLEALQRRGEANGVNLRRLDADGIPEVEPHARGMAALHVLDTGVTDFTRVAKALAGEVEALGGTVLTDAMVERVSDANGRVHVALQDGRTFAAARVICCAGAWSDRLAISSGDDPDPRIVPFRGAYADVRPERAHLVRALIYPVPDPALPFLGVHLTRSVDDHVHVGPTALPAPARDAYSLRQVRAQDVMDALRWPGTWRMLYAWRRQAYQELTTSVSRRALARSAAKYVPAISADDLSPGGAGVRAQALRRDGGLVDDFAVSGSDRILHVRNAPSPAATASLALGELIGDRARIGRTSH